MPIRVTAYAFRLFAIVSLVALVLVAGSTTSYAQDADGDGISDQLDPDDNNNGILDDDEPASSPSEPSEPPDTDGDSIVDQLDPDDDDNGVTDADEPVSGPSSSERPASESTQSARGDQILALPVTGNAPSAAPHPVSTLFWITGAGSVACFAISFWKRRHASSVRP